MSAVESPAGVVVTETAYVIGGRRFPRVTTILAQAIPEEERRRFTEEARERGRRVHTLVDLDLKGTLDPASVDPRLVGYLEAARAFVREFGIQYIPEGVERLVVGLGLMGPASGGRLDLAGWTTSADAWIIDWKSGGPAPWHGLQTAAYASNLMESAEWHGLAGVANFFRPHRATVHLSENGRYRMKEHKLSDLDADIETFRAFARTYHWKKGKSA